MRCSNTFCCTGHIAAALWIAMCVLPASSVAQARVRERLEPTPFSAHATILGVNAFLGGVSAGVLSVANGGSFVDAFARGALGGGLVYSGKNVASRSFTGAGALGRQLAAVGNSVVMNAADNQPMLGRIIVPMGLLPGRVLLTTDGAIRARPIVDLISVAAFATGLISSRYSLDLGTSLSSGVAIFREDYRGVDIFEDGAPERVSGASTVGAVVFINEVLMQSAPTLAHERIHVLQFDFLLASWGDRADTWLVDGARFDRYLKLNGMVGAFGWINQTMFFPSSRHKTPWEREARRMAGQQARPSVVRD